MKFEKYQKEAVTPTVSHNRTCSFLPKCKSHLIFVKSMIVFVHETEAPTRANVKMVKSGLFACSPSRKLAGSGQALRGVVWRGPALRRAARSRKDTGNFSGRCDTTVASFSILMQEFRGFV